MMGMARSCVCSITKEQGNTDIFYCVTEKGKNKYYKSQEIYEKDKQDKIQKQKTLTYVLSILGYEYSPYLSKRLAELNEHFTYEIIYSAFIMQTEKIYYALQNKLSSSKEQQKISYIMKIIESVINDCKPAKEVMKNFDIDINDLNRVNHIPIRHGDITRFLESEDL